MEPVRSFQTVFIGTRVDRGEGKGRGGKTRPQGSVGRERRTRKAPEGPLAATAPYYFLLSFSQSTTRSLEST